MTIVVIHTSVYLQPFLGDIDTQPENGGSGTISWYTTGDPGVLAVAKELTAISGSLNWVSLLA